MAELTGYTKRNIAEECDALHRAGLLAVGTRGNRFTYSLRRRAALEEFVGELPTVRPNWTSPLNITRQLVALEDRARSASLTTLPVHIRTALDRMADDLDERDIEAPDRGIVDEDLWHAVRSLDDRHLRAWAMGEWPEAGEAAVLQLRYPDFDDDARLDPTDRSHRRCRMTAPSLDRGPDSPPLPRTTIPGALAEAVERNGDREALVSVGQGLRFTYRELAERVEQLARGLQKRGVRKGDRVGIWSPNCAEWVLVQYATARIGAVLVTINPAYRTHELAYVLQQSGVSLLISAPDFKTSDYRAMATEAAPDVPAVFLGSPEWDALFVPDGELEEVELQPDEPINIQYTSGTTGFPKGATLSHANILGNGLLVGHLCGYTEQDRVCVPVPFYHCFGMVMGNLGALTHGACVVIPAPAFDPGATLRAVEQERCTSLYGVPTMFIAVLGDAAFETTDLSSLRTGIMAGSPCPVEVMKQVQVFMPEVTICYGMTETSPVSTQTRADDSLDRRVSTVGRVHPHVTVKVVDPATGETVPRGMPGELCTAGYGVMLGYWDDPERTAEAIDRDGFMHTGDLAVMDEDGYLQIVGRSKDMVIRGGENIYPREIEEFLYTHPDVKDVQVVGVPDPKYGEELCAWVQLRDGAVITPDELRDWCKGKLAHYKVPRYVRFCDEFPMTVTGKVQKFKMRETSVAELGLEDAAGVVTA